MHRCYFLKNYANEWPSGHSERLGLEPLGGRYPWSHGGQSSSSFLGFWHFPLIALSSFRCPGLCASAPFPQHCPAPGQGGLGVKERWINTGSSDTSLSPVSVLSSACSHPSLYLILKQPCEASRTGVLALVLWMRKLRLWPAD